jgi:hypothetical protein
MSTYIIPFGSNCIPAVIINRSGGLRKFALPFDWVFAYPEHIKRSLDTDFEEWFQTEHMTLEMGIGDVYSTNHALYPLTEEHYKYGSKGFFEHFNMLDPINQDKYKRAIVRFKEVIESDERIIFLTTIDKDSLAKHGLLDYFKERGNYEFVHIKHIFSDRNTLKFEESDNFVTIKQCTGTPHDLAGEICDYLRNRSGIPNTHNHDGLEDETI